MISSNLTNSQKLLVVVKEKIRNYKKSLYYQTIEEKNNETYSTNRRI